MAYGTARLRAFYGAGDYNRGMALAQYAGGYYPAGGWLSSVGKSIGKAVSAVSKVNIAPVMKYAAPIAKVATPWLKKAGSLIPGVGTAIAGYELAKAGLDLVRGQPVKTPSVSMGRGGLGISLSPMERVQGELNSVFQIRPVSRESAAPVRRAPNPGGQSLNRKLLQCLLIQPELGRRPELAAMNPAGLG